MIIAILKIYMYNIKGMSVMGIFDKEIDITRNIKTIEWLKGELLSDISNLFKVLINGFKEDVHDTASEILANIILISYILGRRLGISYQVIEMKIENKIKLGLLEEHEIETHYGDLSELSKHMNSYRLKRKE